jgi:hypothetical protein
VYRREIRWGGGKRERERERERERGASELWVMSPINPVTNPNPMSSHQICNNEWKVSQCSYQITLTIFLMECLHKCNRSV